MTVQYRNNIRNPSLKKKKKNKYTQAVEERWIYSSDLNVRFSVQRKYFDYKSTYSHQFYISFKHNSNNFILLQSWTSFWPKVRDTV